MEEKSYSLPPDMLQELFSYPMSLDTYKTLLVTDTHFNQYVPMYARTILGEGYLTGAMVLKMHSMRYISPEIIIGVESQDQLVAIFAATQLRVATFTLLYVADDDIQSFFAGPIAILPSLNLPQVDFSNCEYHSPPEYFSLTFLSPEGWRLELSPYKLSSLGYNTELGRIDFNLGLTHLTQNLLIDTYETTLNHNNSFRAIVDLPCLKALRLYLGERALYQWEFEFIHGLTDLYTMIASWMKKRSNIEHYFFFGDEHSIHIYMDKLQHGILKRINAPLPHIKTLFPVSLEEITSGKIYNFFPSLDNIYLIGNCYSWYQSINTPYLDNYTKIYVVIDNWNIDDGYLPFPDYLHERVTFVQWADVGASYP